MSIGFGFVQMLDDRMVYKKNKEDAADYESGTKRMKTTDVGWELRRVPSGPDPLHHFGHTPNKPKTP